MSSGQGTNSATGYVTRFGSGTAITGNQALELTLRDVTNTTTVGSKSLSVSTSSDTTATSASFSLVAASAVSGVVLQRSSPVAGAAQIDYTVDFTTSATGALADGYGTVTFTAPPGTIFPSQSCPSFDVPNDGSYWCMTNGGGTNVATGTVYRTGQPGNALAANETLELTLRGITNTTTLTPGTFSVSTSSDTAGSSAPFSAVTGGAVSGVAVQLSSSVAGATQVDYTVDFTTSATGQLADGNGTITFTAPPGTVFPSYSCPYFTVPNDGTYWCMTNGGGTRVATGTVYRSGLPGNALAANEPVELTLRGVTNSSSLAPGALSVSTSSDTAAASTPLTLVNASPVSDVVVNLSSPVAGATQIDYTIGFTTERDRRPGGRQRHHHVHRTARHHLSRAELPFIRRAQRRQLLVHDQRRRNPRRYRNGVSNRPARQRARRERTRRTDPPRRHQLRLARTGRTQRLDVVRHRRVLRAVHARQRRLRLRREREHLYPGCRQRPRWTTPSTSRRAPPASSPTATAPSPSPHRPEPSFLRTAAPTSRFPTTAATGA